MCIWCGTLWFRGFPGGSAGKESTCKVGYLGSIPGLGRSPGEEKVYPLQYSGLENSMDCIGSQRVGHDWATFTSGLGREKVNVDHALGSQVLCVIISVKLTSWSLQKEWASGVMFASSWPRLLGYSWVDQTWIPGPGEALKSESKEGKFRGIGAVISCRIWAKADAMGPKFKGKSKLWRRVAFQRILTCRGKTGYTGGEKQRWEMFHPQRGKKPDCWWAERLTPGFHEIPQSWH